MVIEQNKTVFHSRFYINSVYKSTDSLLENSTEILGSFFSKVSEVL